MQVLLDTHTMLWFLLEDARLSRNAKSLIESPDNQVLISPASYWEIAIKISLGKYTLEEDFEEFMDREILVNDLTILPITVKHVSVLVRLPFHHRDPFDRLMIAQAISEQVPLISADPVLDRYSITRVWQ